MPSLENVLLTSDKETIQLDGTAYVSLSGIMDDQSAADLCNAMIEYIVSGPIQEPNRPFRHQYHQTLTIKMMMCTKGQELQLRCDQALEIIRKIDNLTLGIPKIVYLVGWQYDGHDTGYPAWDKVNDRIKRPEDAAAIDSLKWLMDEAFCYNTTVSFHINLLDINPDSPLWDEYIQHDLIARNEDGSLKKYKCCRMPLRWRRRPRQHPGTDKQRPYFSRSRRGFGSYERRLRGHLDHC